MGLTMSQRKAVTKAVAARYRRASKAGKGLILDELCATTGWHRNHARKALSAALKPQLVRPAPRPRPPVYGPEVITALGFCWAVMGAPAGKRIAPFLGELVPRLRACGELDVTDASAALMEITEAFPVPIIGIDSGQRRRVHPRTPAGVVHRAPHHVHPIASGEQERRRACGAEELGCGATGRRLPPLRH